jgi:hypothetical protein
MRAANRRARFIATYHAADIDALAHALVPVARLCLKSGMGAGELQIAAKLACVRVAAESARLGNRLNQSGIAAATGLTRKEVRYLAGLIKSGNITAARPAAKQRTARVLHGWRTDPEYLDRRGNPSRLPIRGPGLTFHTLVKRFGGDVTPVAVLNELERSGAVFRIAGARVAVRKATPRVRGYDADVIAEICSRLRDLGATLVSNVECSDDPIFVGFHEIHGLSADEAALFQATFSERAATLVDGVERWSTSQSRIRSRAAVDSCGKTRVGLGVYLIGQQLTPVQPMEKARRLLHGARSRIRD